MDQREGSRQSKRKKKAAKNGLLIDSWSAESETPEKLLEIKKLKKLEKSEKLEAQKLISQRKLEKQQAKLKDIEWNRTLR